MKLYTDQDIQSFISEKKIITSQLTGIFQSLKEKRGHKEASVDIIGEKENSFRVILRQSCFNTLDFSVILAVKDMQTQQIFILRRYNGCSHFHKNKIENVRFRGFHIHYATERYQLLGTDPEGYAVQTEKYNSINGAFELFLDECNFIQSPELLFF